MQPQAAFQWHLMHRCRPAHIVEDAGRGIVTDVFVEAALYTPPTLAAYYQVIWVYLFQQLVDLRL